MGDVLSVGIVQAAAVAGEVDANLATLRRGVRAAAEAGAEVVVTPELFATGYDPARAWQHDGEVIRRRLAEIAASTGVALVASSVDSEDKTASPVHRITASFFDAGGSELSRVHKRNLFGPAEKEFMTPAGTYGRPFRWRGFGIGMGVCYDVEFPEFARCQARAGADLLLVPTAVPELSVQRPGRRQAWGYSATLTSTLQVPARALENGVLIAYANHTGEGFTGHSCIATPFGRNAVVIREGEDVAVVSMEREDLRVAREVNTYLADLGRGPCARP